MSRAADDSPRVLGEFASAAAMLSGLDALQRAHYNDLDTYAPFDIPELDARLGLRRSRLGWLVFGAGVAGLVASYGNQWWANVHDYPLNIGGRPVNAIPAFLWSTFEGTVLAAALAAFFGLLLWLRLPKLWAPVDEIEGFTRASRDRFWIAVGTGRSETDRARAENVLRGSGARRTVRLGGV